MTRLEMIAISLFRRDTRRGEVIRWIGEFFFLMFLVLHNCCQGENHHSVHHKMTKRELRHVFDADDHRQVPPYELIDSKSLTWKFDASRQNPDQLRLLFDAFSQRFDVHLSPHDSLLSPDLITVIRDGSNSSLYYGLPKAGRCHFRGTAVSHGNAAVALSNCTYLRGSVALSDHFLVIHPLPKRFHNSTLHVIYKRSAALVSNGAIHVHNRVKRDSSNEYLIDNPPVERDDDSNSEEQFCEVTSTENNTLPSLALRDDTSSSTFGYGPITLELALFLDAQLYEHFIDEFGPARGEQELMDFSLALINNVYMLYQQPSMQPKLEVVIVRFELWKTQPEDIEGSKHKNGEAQLFLDAFCSYQAQMNPANRASKAGRWDHATLLTGFDIYHTTSSVAGVAPVARMCDPVFSCSLVEGLHLGRSFVLAHEMGHNLGMVHDGVQNQCSRSCCLMSAVNGAGKTTWSPCSVREFNAYLLSLGSAGAAPNCLSDGEHAVEAKDHKNKGLPPGQRFTADQQCSFFWGREFRNEVPAGKTKSDICNIVWCGNGGSTISTSHPALEGTWCGAGKWCINGRCTSWPAGSPVPAAVDGAWSHWTAPSTSPCTDCKIKDGVRIRREIRGCDEPAPNNGGHDCKGAPIRGLLCGSVGSNSVCADVEKQRFADEFCSSLRDDGTGRGDTDLSGTSFLHGTAPCKIWCHLGDTKLIRNKGFFPDGTPCGAEKYCVEGECLELSCDRKALVFDSPNDCPVSADNPGWLAWSAWTSCSATCGKGSRSRNRKCSSNQSSCNGDGNEQQECNAEDCSTWSEWSAWAECSVTCGSGTRVRTRTCGSGSQCSGDATQFEQCNSTACGGARGAWSEWTGWSVCTKTCGSDGQRSRRRVCQASGDQCIGESQQTESCPRRDCSSGASSWSEWGGCSVTCGSGRQSRTRPCPFNIDPSKLTEQCVDGALVDSRDCNTQPCADQVNQSEWSPFGPCSVTCGPGHQSRTRTCPSKGSCDGGPTYESKPCILKACLEDTTASVIPTTAQAGSGDGWGDWAQWSSCSRSCAVRFCQSSSPCPPSGSIQIDNCNVNDCDASWSSWSAWTSCSITCGSGGRHSRTRRCLAAETSKCDGTSNEESACDNLLPPCDTQSASVAAPSGPSPEWSQWSGWSACSCFNEKAIRRRYCRILQPSVLGFCIGPVLEEHECTATNCTPVAGGWSAWSEWSHCSTDCSPSSGPDSAVGGYRIRQRHCSDPFPANHGPYCFGQSFEKAPCTASLPSCSGSAVDGGWSQWSSWSPCSTSCTNGHRSRTRYCTNPRPSNGGQPCQGLDFNLEVCQASDSCPSAPGGWGDWSSWSSCGQTCGFAFQSRQRFCDSPKPSNSQFCIGLARMTRLCALPQCPNAVSGGWSDWSDWSSCSAQCGFGVRERNRNCSNPRPLNSGTPCVGASMDFVMCTGQERKCSTFEEHFESLETLVREQQN